MFDFKKEINRFKPILEIDEVENSINTNEVQDIMDLLELAIKEKKSDE